MMIPYEQHGHRHGPFGSDPSPPSEPDLTWGADFITPILFAAGVSPTDPANVDATGITRIPPGVGLPFLAWLKVKAGTGYTAGSGDYYLEVPDWAGSISSFGAEQVPFGQGITRQHSSGITYPAFLIQDFGITDPFRPGISFLDPADNLLKLMNDSSPFAWADGDTIFAGTLMAT